MKITLNKTAITERKEEVINEILKKAQEHAQKGIKSFTYNFKEGERNSFPGACINISVSNASEGTVKCGYRSDYGSYVKYYITE
jgi:hypothetical protein